MQKIVSSFGLSDVAIALPGTGGSTPSWIDVPAVNAATFKQSVQEVEQFGDDEFMATFRHNQRGNITIKGSQASMEVFELLSGNTASSLTGGAGMILIGTDGEKQPPFICVRATINVTKSDGTTGNLVAYWYKCQVMAPFAGYPDGAYGKLGEVQVDLHVYKHEKDEKGNTVPQGKVLGRVELP